MKVAESGGAGSTERSVGGVVTLGEVMGLFLAVDGRPLPVARDFELGYAGAEATVAVGLARLGHRATYAGRLGDDPVGRRIQTSLRGEGVDVSALRTVPGAKTGLLVRDHPTDRPIMVQYHRSGSAASGLSPDDVPEDAIRDAAVLHVTGISAVLSDSSRKAVERAVAVAREAGTTVSLDPNVRLKLATPATWAEVLDPLARKADIVLTGVDDAAVVTDGDPAAWFLERGARTVVVKDGERGSWEHDGTAAVHQPAVPTTCVDPVGAGDAYAAGWLGGLLDGLPPEQRLLGAATVASLCVGAAGDVTGLPDAQTLAEILGRGTEVDR